MKDIFTPELTICHAQNIDSKKQVLSLISGLIAEADSRLKAQHILESLTERERLGCTAVGYGFAIPHARIQSLTKALCVVVTLPAPINFDSEDHPQMVDNIFGLLVPEKATEEHLEHLSEIAQRIKSSSFRHHVKNADNHSALYQALVQQTV